MTHRLTTDCAKNYCNQTLIVKVIVENVVTCFFGTRCRNVKMWNIVPNYSTRSFFLKYWLKLSGSIWYWERAQHDCKSCWYVKVVDATSAASSLQWSTTSCGCKRLDDVCQRGETVFSSAFIVVCWISINCSLHCQIEQRSDMLLTAVYSYL